ncbi:putative subunit of the heterotrimeric G protein [Atractiella rhizophila]|nr:putative subunit of the heterotrimeric G protein [Atractiella rhizophila]
MSNKRPPSPEGTLIISKRSRTDGSGEEQQMVVASAGEGKGALVQGVKRTSGLQAPIMCLTGHQGEILDLKFDPSGSTLASSSTDKLVYLWRVYGDCANYGVLKGSKGAVTAIEWSQEGGMGGTSDKIFASTASNQMLLFSPVTGELVRRYRSHRGILNSLSLSPVAPNLVATGSDDCTVRIHSPNEAAEIDKIDIGHPVTAVEWLGGAGSEIAIGGVDNDIHIYDLRKKAVLYSLRGHQDTITSLRLSPNKSFLLSSSSDSLVKIWDIKPFVPVLNPIDPVLPPRLYRILGWAPAGFENWLRQVSWSNPSYGHNGKTFVAVGSADRSVTIWDSESGEIKFKLPGHRGTVIATDFSPREPIIASGGVDKLIYLGEIDVR